MEEKQIVSVLESHGIRTKKVDGVLYALAGHVPATGVEVWDGVDIGSGTIAGVTVWEWLECRRAEE